MQGEATLVAPLAGDVRTAICGTVVNELWLGHQIPASSVQIVAKSVCSNGRLFALKEVLLGGSEPVLTTSLAPELVPTQR